MEKFIYEHRPHFYLALAIYSLVISRNSALMIGSGLLLLGCAYYVYNVRHTYRKNLEVYIRQMRALK
jgi:hypothetical protein